MNLPEYLDQQGISYRMSEHPTVYTSQDLAATEHVPGRSVIKPVVVRADGRFIMCALPASYRVDLAELRRQLDAGQVALAEEAQLGDICPDCELGAAPPIGRMFGLPTVMDESLMADDHVMFQAGTHEKAVTMTLADYRRLAQPELAHFGRHA